MNVNRIAFGAFPAARIGNFAAPPSLQKYLHLIVAASALSIQMH